MSLRNSDLTRIRNDTSNLIREVASPRQKLAYELVLEESLSREEVAHNMNISVTSVYSILSILRKKIIAYRPFFNSSRALRYKGSARVINMLAIECERRGAFHAEASYQEITSNIEDILRQHGTGRQRQVYYLYFGQGMTQTAAAEELEVCQPTLYKSIMGNFDYSKNKFYGGIVSKVGKHLRRRGIPYCCNLVDSHGRFLAYMFNRYRA